MYLCTKLAKKSRFFSIYIQERKKLISRKDNCEYIIKTSKIHAI